MPRFKQKECKAEGCSKFFLPSGPSARYCEECSRSLRLESARRRTSQYRIRHGLVEKPGSGKGGNNSKGVLDSQYKSGIVYFMKSRPRVKKERGDVCERCKTDLSQASRYEWVIHHRDHDRSNNGDSNFELLCKRCHQLEHDCISALPSSKV